MFSMIQLIPIIRKTTAIGATAWACVAGLQAQAQTPAALPSTPEVSGERGFSYFIGLAYQRSRYREEAAGLSVRSEASSGSPLLVTGALYALGPDLLASLDNETTFAPSTVTETWTATAPMAAGIALTSPVLQTNRFRFSDTTTRLMGHWRVQGPWFALGGLALRTQSYQRFAYTAGPDQVVNITAGQTTEETDAEVLLQLGAGLESEALVGRDSHYGVRAVLGLPVWRRVENTAFPQARFDRLGGWDLGLEARYSRALRRDVQLGGWLKVAQSYRPGDSAGGGVELPRHRLGQVAAGVELLWKL